MALIKSKKRRKEMKKAIAIFLATIMIMALAACGNIPAAETPSATATEAPAPAVETEEAAATTEEDIDWPTKTIEIIVGYSPGGDTDTYVRSMIDALSEELGVPVIITNKVGATGTVASEYVRTSDPDGYTLFWQHNALLTSRIFGQVDYHYDAFDVANLCLYNGSTYLFSATEKWDNFEDLIAYAKEHPGEILVGASPGSYSYLTAVLVEAVCDVDFNIVDMTNAAEGAVELMSGRLDMTVAQLAAYKDYVETGDLTPMVCFNEERQPNTPNTPTLAELGYQQLNNYWQYGFFFPKGTDPKIIDKFNDACEAVTSRQDIQDYLATMNTEVRFYRTTDALEKWDAMWNLLQSFKDYF